MLIPLFGHSPQIAADVFIAPTAVVIGQVEIGSGASLWYGAVLRGDNGRIVIGRGSNVQDNATIHVTSNVPTLIGDNVTIGHGAVLEGCVVEAGALIGMNAVVLPGAVIGRGSLVAAGSVVPEGMVIPPHTLVAGVPARVKKTLDAAASARIERGALHYQQLARAHRLANQSNPSG